MKLGAHLFDAVRLSSRVVPAQRLSAGAGLRLIPTPAGSVRVRDTGPSRGDGATVVIAPDGPNVIEHYEGLVDRLAGHLRVVVLDLPGFGFSYPSTNYRFRLDEGAEVILAVMDALGVENATLSFSCANGYYAAAAAKEAPDRVHALVLVQTPSYQAMRAWTAKSIPRIIGIPGVGQVLMSLSERKAAHEWYRIALPNRNDASKFQEEARRAFDLGGCFCLAGIVQGLLGEDERRLANLNTPTIVIWGDRDRSHRHTLPNSANDLFPSARIEIFEGCGHFADLERPDRFAALLLQASRQ